MQRWRWQPSPRLVPAPKPGPQPYDIGYHGGRKKSQHGSFPGAIGFISADDPERRPKFFQMCGEVMEKYKAAGGDAKVLVHAEYGHHPHGVESGEAKIVLDFF